MSAFKKLNKQDVFVTTYSAKKSWSVTGSLFESYNILSIPAYSGSGQLYVGSQEKNVNPTGSFYNLNYKSLEQLYYRSFYDENRTQSGSIFYSSSYDHYLESSLTSGSRYLGVSASIFSLPREIVGTHIEPGSILAFPPVTTTSSLYIVDGYVQQDELNSENLYFQNLSIPYLNSTGEIRDNGEGVLYVVTPSGSVDIGNVIYSHGMLILTNRVVAAFYNSGQTPTLSWKSNQPIYTYNYHCKIKDAEFNMTQHPSIMSGSSVYTENSSSYFRPSGNVKSFATGSDFQPYFTTVGLYNDTNELIAVAKLGKAIPKSTNSDMTVVVKLDI